MPSYTLPNKCVVWLKFSSAPLFRFSTYLPSESRDKLAQQASRMYVWVRARTQTGAPGCGGRGRGLPGCPRACVFYPCLKRGITNRDSGTLEVDVCIVLGAAARRRTWRAQRKHTDLRHTLAREAAVRWGQQGGDKGAAARG